MDSVWTFGSPLPACGARSTRIVRCAAGEGDCPRVRACREPPHPDPLPASGRAVRGKSCIVEPQLIGREVGFWLAWIHWWRGGDFRDRFSHEQALGGEFRATTVR